MGRNAAHISSPMGLGVTGVVGAVGAVGFSPARVSSPVARVVIGSCAAGVDVGAGTDMAESAEVVNVCVAELLDD
jgi:hypothetical protein